MIRIQKNTLNRSKRDSNLDLLRIIAMMMIVSMHYFGWGGLLASEETSRINYILAGVIHAFCRVAVNVFYMVSGYYMLSGSGSISLKSISKRVIKIWRKVAFYSVGLTLVAVVLGIIEFSASSLIYSAFPILTDEYWFITVFIFLDALRPYFNRLLKNLNQKELQILLVILLAFDSMHTLIGIKGLGGSGYSILHGVTMLILGYSMNVFQFFNLKKWTGLLLYFVACGAGGVLTIINQRILHTNIEFLHYNAPLAILASVGVFAFFGRMKFQSAMISWTAPYVLTIYLINDNPVIRSFLWKDVLHCSAFFASNWMIVHYVFCVVFYTILGIGLDFILTTAFEKNVSWRRKRDSF